MAVFRENMSLASGGWPLGLDWPCFWSWSLHEEFHCTPSTKLFPHHTLPARMHCGPLNRNISPKQILSPLRCFCQEFCCSDRREATNVGTKTQADGGVSSAALRWGEEPTLNNVLHCLQRTTRERSGATKENKCFRRWRCQLA